MESVRQRESTVVKPSLQRAILILGAFLCAGPHSIRAQESGLNLKITHDPVDYGDRYRNNQFVLKVTAEEPTSLGADMIFLDEFGQERRQDVGVFGKQGELWLNISPLTRPFETEEQLRVLLLQGDKLQKGAIDNRKIMVGRYEVDLRTIAEIERNGRKYRITNVKGQTLEAPLSGLEQVNFIYSKGESRVVNLLEMDRICITPGGTELTQLPYRVEVKKDGRVVDSLEGQLAMVNSPPEAERLTEFFSKYGTDSSTAQQVKTADPVKVALPGEINRAFLAGGDRYLVMNVPAQREILVYDVERRGMEGSIVVPGDEPYDLVAGQECIVVAYLESKRFQSYALPSLSQGLEAPYPAKELITFGMGAAAKEFMVLGKTEANPYAVIFVDGTSLEVTRISDVKEEANGVFDESPFVRASADGSTYGFTGTEKPKILQPTGQQIVVRGEDGEKSYYDSRGQGNATPNSDGSLIYTNKGWMAPNLMGASRPSVEDIELYIPTVHPLFVLGHNCSYGKANSASPRLGVFLKGHERPLLDLRPLPEFVGSDRTSNHTYYLFADRVGIDQRFMLFPERSLLLMIPPDSNALLLLDVDLLRYVQESNMGFLHVTSTPPASVMAGTLFTYHIETQTNRDGLRFQLDSGPAGMEVSVLGRVQWNTDPSHAKRSFSCRVSVSSRDGMVAHHQFVVKVVPRTQF